MIVETIASVVAMSAIATASASASGTATCIRWAIFLVLGFWLYQTIRKLIQDRREKMNRKEVVPGFPTCPGAHWLVGHLLVLRGLQEVPQTNTNTSTSANTSANTSTSTRIQEGAENDASSKKARRSSNSNSSSSKGFVGGYKWVHCDYADPVTGMSSFWFFNIPVVVFLRGKDARKVMLSSSYRHQAWYINKHTRKFLGQKALLSLMKKDWRYYRTAVHKSFTTEVIKQSRPYIYKVGNTLVDALLQKEQQQRERESSSSASPLPSLSERARSDAVNAVNAVDAVDAAEDESSISDDDNTIKPCCPPQTKPKRSDSTVVPVPIVDGTSNGSCDDTDTDTVLVLPLMKMAAIDVFGSVALRSNGVDFGCTRNLKLSPIASAFDGLTMEFTRRLKRPWDPLSFLYGIPTKANRDYNRQRTFIRTFISDQIAQTRARIAAAANSDCDGERHQHQHQHERDLLTNLITAADSENAKAHKAGQHGDNHHKKELVLDTDHDEALGDILMTLLFGGYDTTSISVTYALYLLAKNPSKRTKCLAEVDCVLGNYYECEKKATATAAATATATAAATSAGGGKFSPPSPPGLDELPYTKAVMLESLRLYPPVPATARNIEKPVTIAGDGGGCEAQQGGNSNGNNSGRNSSSDAATGNDSNGNNTDSSKAITLPEGQMVVLPIWSIQRSELNYSRPNDMIPERWVRRKRQKGANTDTNKNKNNKNRDSSSSSSIWEVRPPDDSHGDDDDQNPEDTEYIHTGDRDRSEGISSNSNSNSRNCHTNTTISDEEREDEAIPPANRDAFCAFAAGARNCVGKKLAIEESVILLACLVHRLSFELVSEDYEVSPSIVAVVQQPDDYLPMKVRGRLLKERTNLEQTRSPL